MTTRRQPGVLPLPQGSRHNRRKAVAVNKEDELPLSSRLCLLDFLWPGPSGIPASIGDTKAIFMARLGLNDGIPYHKSLFEQMKVESARGCSSLLTNVKEITSIAIDEVEREVFNSACSATRCIYEVVAPAADNWVIRWMLWHVIENSGTQPMSHPLVSGMPSPRKSPDDDAIAPKVTKEVRFQIPSEEPKSSPQVGPGRRDYWDPIRSP